MTALRSIVVLSFAIACGGAPPPESAPAPVPAPEPAPTEPVASEPPAPDTSAPVASEEPAPTRTPEQCAQEHPELSCPHWSVQMATFFAPCCGNMGSGPVCVCNACETDADCRRGAVCRELQSQQHLSPTTTARVCLSRRDPCFHDPPRCGPLEYCAHDGEGHAECMRIQPAPP